MRKLLRSIARHNMKEMGITQINKRPWGVNKLGQSERLNSKFARTWLDYIHI
jgi:hypothetical protein